MLSYVMFFLFQGSDAFRNYLVSEVGYCVTYLHLRQWSFFSQGASIKYIAHAENLIFYFLQLFLCACVRPCKFFCFLSSYFLFFSRDVQGRHLPHSIHCSQSVPRIFFRVCVFAFLLFGFVQFCVENIMFWQAVLSLVLSSWFCGLSSASRCLHFFCSCCCFVCSRCC